MSTVALAERAPDRQGKATPGAGITLPNPADQCVQVMDARPRVSLCTQSLLGFFVICQ